MATFATWNPSDKEANIVLSWGDLIARSNNTLWRNVRSTIWKSSWKWYWEVTTTLWLLETMVSIGTTSATLWWSGALFPWSDAFSYGYYGNGWSKFNNNSWVAYGAWFTTNDVIWVALDMDSGTLTFYKNGSSQWTAFTWLSGTFYAMVGLDSLNQTVTANFWASTFASSVPSGFNPGLTDVPLTSNKWFFNFF